MKKLSLCLMLCFLFLGNLAAQWSVGGKVGVDWSKMTYPIDGMDTHFKVGATLGAVANYQLNDWLDLQGELLYSQHNYKDEIMVVNEGGLGRDEALKGHSHYIDVPLLVKFYPLKHDSGFNLEAGIQPGFFLAQSAKLGEEDFSDYGNHNPVSCALLVGTSFHAPKNWFIDLRYAFGLTPTYKENDRFKTQSLQLSLGYLFQL